MRMVYFRLEDCIATVLQNLHKVICPPFLNQLSLFLWLEVAQMIFPIQADVFFNCWTLLESAIRHAATSSLRQKHNKYPRYLFSTPLNRNSANLHA
jgi:hypothetical protein